MNQVDRINSSKWIESSQSNPVNYVRFIKVGQLKFIKRLSNKGNLSNQLDLNDLIKKTGS